MGRACAARECERSPKLALLWGRRALLQNEGAFGCTVSWTLARELMLLVGSGRCTVRAVLGGRWRFIRWAQLGHVRCLVSMYGRTVRLICAHVAWTTKRRIGSCVGFSHYALAGRCIRYRYGMLQSVSVAWQKGYHSRQKVEMISAFGFVRVILKSLHFKKVPLSPKAMLGCPHGKK